MGFDRFFTGIVMLLVGVGLMWVLGAALDEVGTISSASVTGTVLLFAHGAIVLGIVGMAACAWSSDQVRADRLARYVLLVLAGLLVINGNWGIATSLAILSSVLIWHQLCSRPGAEAQDESPAADRGTEEAAAPAEPPVE